jgi:hypothetical protein
VKDEHRTLNTEGIEEAAGKCESVIVTNRDAYILRENTGTSGVVQTARTVAAVLAQHDIPHLIVGGIAVNPTGRAFYVEIRDALQAET